MIDDLDEDTRDELRYKLILVRYNEDDPIREAYLIKQLKDAYDKYKVKMSDKLKIYIKGEVKKIEEYISKELPKKKAEYDKLTSKKSKKVDAFERKHRIFSDEDIAKF